ncbi:MAG: hypothetical protein JKY56_06840 [Kofleriaceae bacterium]|nr:hypothetical protein [Kofleriaceae bacterium]
MGMKARTSVDVFEQLAWPSYVPTQIPVPEFVWKTPFSWNRDTPKGPYLGLPRGLETGFRKKLPHGALCGLGLATSEWIVLALWPTLSGAQQRQAWRTIQWAWLRHLLVSDWLSKKYQLEQLTALHQQPNIEVRVGAIPVHSSGKIPFARVIHSKYMTVDGKTLWLGTSNWSKGYFTQSRNVALILRKPELTASAELIHDTLWNGRYVKPITEWAKSR